jgi:hypothetical protein
LTSQLVIPSQVLSAAILTFFSIELKFDKSTPCGPYMISPIPYYNFTTTISNMPDS